MRKKNVFSFGLKHVSFSMLFLWTMIIALFFFVFLRKECREAFRKKVHSNPRNKKIATATATTEGDRFIANLQEKGVSFKTAKNLVTMQKSVLNSDKKTFVRLYPKVKKEILNVFRKNGDVKSLSLLSLSLPPSKLYQNLRKAVRSGHHAHSYTS